MSVRSGFQFELALCLTVSAACLAIGALVQWWVDAPWALLFTSGAIGICLFATLPPLWLRFLPFRLEATTFFPILTMCWRSGVILVPIVVAAATKWAHVYSFSLTLLGCYFPFLVLESALSIRRIRSDSGPPRQHVQHNPPH